MTVASTALHASDSRTAGSRSDSRARLRRARARWRAARWHGWERGWRRSWQVGTGTFLAKFTPGAMVVGAELALWGFPFPPMPYPRPLTLKTWWLLWLVVIVVNGSLVAWLTEDSPMLQGGRARLARVGLKALGSIPLIAFVSLPLARWLEGKSRCDLSTVGERVPCLSLAGLGQEQAASSTSSMGQPPPRRRGGLLFFGALLWLLLPNMALVLLSAVDLAQRGRPLGSTAPLLGLTISGHLVGAALTLLDRLEPAAGEGRRNRSPWLGLGWLLPLPVMIPVLLVGSFRSLRDRGLTGRAWLGRGFLEASPRWSRLLGQLWGGDHDGASGEVGCAARRRPPELDGTADAWLAVGQIRSSLLCTEGLALGYFLGRALDASSENQGPIVRGLFGLFLAGGVLLAAAAVVRLLARVRRHRGVFGSGMSPAEMPVVRPLLLSLGALWGGLPVGAVVVLGDGRLAAEAVAASLLLAPVIVGCILILRAPGLAVAMSMRRYLCLFSFQAVLVVVMVRTHLLERSPAGEALFWSLMLAAFCSGFVVTLTAHRRMIHPFGIADLVRPGISRTSRWKLIFVVATSVLPLGGLLAPLWPCLLQGSRREGFTLRLRAQEGTS